MTTQKKNYTNADIIKRLDNMATDIDMLKVWKLSQEAGRAAVDEYKRQEVQDKDDKNKSDIYDKLRDAYPYIMMILAAILVLLYAHSQGANNK
jgi:uncharacterized membrane protein